VGPRSISERVYEGDRPGLEAALQKALDPNTDGCFECVGRFRRFSDGAERWIVARGRVNFDRERRPLNMVGTLLDVTARQRETERQRFLADATSLLATTLDDREIFDWITRLAVPTLGDWAAVDLVMPDGTIERVAVTHKDDGKAELVKEVARRFPPDPNQATGPRAVIRSGKPELISHASPEMIDRLSRSDAHTAMMRQMGIESYVCVPLIAHGEVLGAFSIVSTHPGRRFDAADLDLALDLAQRAALNVDNARLYKQSLDSAKQRERMLAVVAHDLRNPLNAIVVAGSLLTRRFSQLPGEDRARRHAEIVERSSRRMEDLIDHLLDVASIQAGRLVVETRPQLASSLLDEVHELEVALASEHGIALLTEDGASRGAAVKADRARLLEVFENLVGNAIKFCHSGDSITVSAKDGDGCVVFSVADTGPGIAAEERERIFEPYWSSKRARGTGLGLFIAKGIVEAHGGSIWVQSEPGAGTTFFFTVPLSAVAEDADAPRPSVH
jgi:signal transduction histidine kinase